MTEYLRRGNCREGRREGLWWLAVLGDHSNVRAGMAAGREGRPAGCMTSSCRDQEEINTHVHALSLFNAV